MEAADAADGSKDAKDGKDAAKEGANEPAREPADPDAAARADADVRAKAVEAKFAEAKRALEDALRAAPKAPAPGEAARAELDKQLGDLAKTEPALAEQAW